MSDSRRPHSKTTLLVGFDSAWTCENRGALIPERRKTFSIDDWRYVCDRLSEEITACKLWGLVAWISEVKARQSPSKREQDGIDACICLLVALYLIGRKSCLMVGHTDTGYIVVPHGDGLRREIEECSKKTHRDPTLWVRTFALKSKDS